MLKYFKDFDSDNFNIEQNIKLKILVLYPN